MAAILTIFANTSGVDQGQTEDRPTPVPNTNKIRNITVVTKAPPMTATLDKPDKNASLVLVGSANVD